MPLAFESAALARGPGSARHQSDPTEAIVDILGYRGRDELIHRDDLVLL